MDADLRLVLRVLHESPSSATRDRYVRIMAESVREAVRKESKPRADLLPLMLGWALRSKNKKQYQLAEELGVHRVVFGRWYRGQITRLNKKTCDLLTPLWLEWAANELGVLSEGET